MLKKVTKARFGDIYRDAHKIESAMAINIHKNENSMYATLILIIKVCFFTDCSGLWIIIFSKLIILTQSTIEKSGIPIIDKGTNVSIKL